MSSKNDSHYEFSDFLKICNHSLILLKDGKFSEALEAFNYILKNKYYNSIAESGVKCCKYWIPRIHKINDLNKNKKGEIILETWKKFENFISSIKNIDKKVKENIMYYIFNKALDSLQDCIKNDILDFQTAFIIGVSYKKTGEYHKAVYYFMKSLFFNNNNPNAMSQLADCYALLNEEKKAKLLFREAFFIEPNSIDVELFDSEIINTLILKISELGIDKNELAYWIPIYGRVFGIFNIYRELLAEEIIRLKKETINIERIYKNEEDNKKSQLKLLNNYFWLYDYKNIYEKNNDELLIIEENIKKINEPIFNIFKKNTMIEQEIK